MYDVDRCCFFCVGTNKENWAYNKHRQKFLLRFPFAELAALFPYWPVFIALMIKLVSRQNVYDYQWPTTILHLILLIIIGCKCRRKPPPSLPKGEWFNRQETKIMKENERKPKNAFAKRWKQTKRMRKLQCINYLPINICIQNEYIVWKLESISFAQSIVVCGSVYFSNEILIKW